MAELPHDSHDTAADSLDIPGDAPPTPAKRLRRLGCVAGLLLWLVVMLIPCFFIALAVQQEIVITQGSAPNQVLRFWLINEADHRGVGMSSASLHSGSQDNGICVQTDVRFLLWTGQSEPTSYCECYAPVGDNLELTGASDGQCTP
jgi:hypothetical protein